jgi:hypothetical protein
MTVVGTSATFLTHSATVCNLVDCGRLAAILKERLDYAHG